MAFERGAIRGWLGLVLALGLAGAGALLVRRRAAIPEGGAFVGREACVLCHEIAGREWTGSDHDWAMKPATSLTVLGNFADATLVTPDVTSRFFRRDERYFVNTQGSDGRIQDFEIRYTFGYQPLQEYVVELPDGRRQVLDLAWDVPGQRWLSLHGDERVALTDPRHWTGPGRSWEARCADCHSTNVRRERDSATGRSRATFAEVEVSCEACHGPGATHVRWVRASTIERLLLGAGPRGFPRPLTGPAQLNACAPCHSARRPVSASFTAGARFFDGFLPEPLRAGLYYPDGQILGEVYEYGSFAQSREQERGVVCSDCHDPHSTRVHRTDNGLCTRCHVAATYDTTAHHHHVPESPGARCVECHMPARTYLGSDARRDHRLRVPRPDVALRLGTPDPCTACHADRSPAWAAEALIQGHGPTRPGPEPFADAIAGGRAGRPEAEAGLLALAGDGARPAIVRATAVVLLGGYGSAAAAEAVGLAVVDPDPLVRAAATEGAAALAPVDRWALLAPLLDDSLRAVRVATARVLAPTRVLMSDARVLAALDRAVGELEAVERRR